VEILKWLHETVCRKRPELQPNDWILHNDNTPAHKVLSVKQLLTQKSIIETEHPLCSFDLAPNTFWLFPKIKFALKGRKFQDTEDIQKKFGDITESYSITGVPKMFPTVAALLGYVHGCSRGVLLR
jgi:hypothetical protein